MWTFLTILLAVITALLILAAAGYGFIRRQVRRAVNEHALAAELLDQRMLKPARIRLRPANAIETSTDFDTLWRQLNDKGFARLSDLSDESGSLVIRAAKHGTQPVLAALVEDGASSASFTLFALDTENRMTAISTEAGQAFHSPRLRWQVDTSLDVNGAWQQLQQLLQGTECRDAELRVFRAAWEQAYAVRTDAALADAPTRADVERRAGDHKPEQVDQAYELLREHWLEQVEEAVLDRYRRSSRIDAVSWERMAGEIHVVHNHLEPEQIEDLLVEDELSERVFQQGRAQGYEGVALYEQVMQRLPSERRRERLAEIQRPVRAVVYGPSEGPQRDSAGQFVYQAEDTDGQTISGVVVADNSTDARRQVENMGFERARLVVEPNAVDRSMDEPWLDPALAEVMARASQESLGRSVVRALRSNLWIWGPPAALLAWTLSGGTPFGWGDYLIMLYTVAAAAAMVFLVAPLVLYDLFQRAFVAGHWSAARFCIAALRRVSLFTGLSESILTLERAKVMAASGDEEAAVEAWTGLASTMQPHEHIQGLVQIYDAAGNHAAQIREQRALLRQTAAKETPTVDLAMSLAQDAAHVDEADALLGKVSPGDLSELAIAGYQTTRGLIAAQRGSHDRALHHYAQALEQIQLYRNNPLVLAFIAVINARAAVSLKSLGRTDQAGQVWNRAWRLLRHHPGSERLRLAYETA